MWLLKLNKGGLFFMVKKLSKTPFSIRILTQVSMLIALEIVLSRFLSINTQVFKIGFSFIPIVICAAAYGPLWAGAAAAAADIIGALLFPSGPFMPGITLDALLRGVVLGFAFYGLELKPKIARFWIRITSVVVFNSFIFSLLLNSYWLSLIYSKGFIYFFTSRILQEAILIPICIAINPILIGFVWRMRKTGLIDSEYIDEEAVSWRKISASILLGCLVIALTVGFTGLLVERNLNSAISEGTKQTATLGSYFTDEEAAAYLKITSDKLTALISDGSLTGTYQTVGDQRIFSRAALDTWFSNQLGIN
jgi:DNA binding domain, excisionase family